MHRKKFVFFSQGGATLLPEEGAVRRPHQLLQVQELPCSADAALRTARSDCVSWPMASKCRPVPGCSLPHSGFRVSVSRLLARLPTVARLVAAVTSDRGTLCGMVALEKLLCPASLGVVSRKLDFCSVFLVWVCVCVFHLCSCHRPCWFLLMVAAHFRMCSLK